MLEPLEISRMARALAAHSGARLGVIAQNVAHADTPGYRTRDLPAFADIYRETGEIRATRLGHIRAAQRVQAMAFAVPGGDAPNGNTVSLEAEMVKSAEARQAHEMALAIQRTVSDITKLSLGRGR